MSLSKERTRREVVFSNNPQIQEIFMSDRLVEIDALLLDAQNAKDVALSDFRLRLIADPSSHLVQTEREEFSNHHKTVVLNLNRERDEIFASLPKDPDAITLYPAGIKSEEYVGGLG